MPKLIASVVNKLTPREKPYEVRDEQLKGFLVRVQPTGQKTFYFAYKPKSGRKNRYRIGSAASLTAQQARDIAIQLTAEVAQGGDPQQQKKESKEAAKKQAAATLEGFIEHRYRDWVLANRKTGEATLKRLESNFAFLYPRPMVEITTWLVEKWRLVERKKGKATTTINRDVVVLKAVLAKALEWHLIDVNPLAGVRPLKTDSKGKVRYLSQAEEQKLRKALTERDAEMKAKRASANKWREARGYELYPNTEAHEYADHLTPMVILALNTGMRRGELFSLQWDNVDLVGRVLTIEGGYAKSGLTRHIQLNEEAVVVLEQWQEQSAKEGLVFPSKDGGTLGSVRTSWGKLLKKAGISNFRFHDLRHTFASKLVMAGVDLNTVRDLMGHSDIAMTLRYAHLAPEHKAEAVAKLVAT